jgi:hypothetical protein
MTEFPRKIQSIRPHLERVINERYPPTQTRLNKYYKTPGSGKGINQCRGNISQHYIEDVIKRELCRWAPGTPVGGGVMPSSQRRPTGSARYESLNEDQRETVSFGVQVGMQD